MQFPKMKREQTLLGLMLMMLIPFFLRAQQEKKEKPAQKTDIVAIVDNRYLRRAELEERIEKLLTREGRQQDPEEDEEAFRRFAEGEVIEEWVNIALLAAEAEKRGLKVTDEELHQKLEQLKKEYAPTLNIDIALQRAGFTRDEFLQEMRDALLGEKLLHDHINKLYSEAQLREFYIHNPELFIKPPMVRVQHIFRLLVGTETKAEREKIYEKMQELRRRALKGEDFQNLAAESDAFSRYRGGDLGWLTPDNRLPEPINAQIFELKPGQISKVLLDKKEYGYHLVKVLEKKPSSGLTFEEARADVEAYLFNQEKNNLLEQLRLQHRVIINLSGIPEAKAFPTNKK